MINTKSSFYYGYTVTANNFALDFDEGLGELDASVAIKNYSFTTLANGVAVALNNKGSQTYSVTLNRETRKYTISASSNFDLLVTTGSRAGTSIFSLLGFTSDKTGSNSYESDASSGVEYLPQFKLQDFVPSENIRRRIESKINQSSTGVVEIVSFGTVNFTEFNITNITDRPQSDGGLIDNDASAVSKARNFLEAITDKQLIEFMPDRDNKSTFETLLLESTPESKEGVEFKLKELFTRRLQDWFETGKLIFRKV